MAERGLGHERAQNFSPVRRKGKGPSTKYWTDKEKKLHQGQSKRKREQMQVQEKKVGRPGEMAC